IVWGPIQGGIDSVGNWMISAGSLGVGMYGFFNRLLIPVGLHHVIKTVIWFDFGEFTNAAGEVVKGDIHRFLAGD
uniref:PTS transporter subunit EIIC n=1 Tax=Bacillus cereus TaxID=1396 RepID=UPI00201BC1CD